MCTGSNYDNDVPDMLDKVFDAAVECGVQDTENVLPTDQDISNAKTCACTRSTWCTSSTEARARGRRFPPSRRRTATSCAPARRTTRLVIVNRYTNCYLEVGQIDYDALEAPFPAHAVCDAVFLRGAARHRLGETTEDLLDAFDAVRR